MNRPKFLFWTALIVVGAVALYFLNPVKYGFMPKCPFKMITGWSCPGCGFQRAVHAFLHGRFTEAIRYNLFFVFGIPYLCAILFANNVMRGEKQLKVLAFLEGRFMVTVYIVLFFVWLVVRNILNI